MVELRQSRLAKNADDMERWMAKLLRAAHEIEKLRAQRKRLLRGPSKKGYTPMEPTGIGGGAIDGLNDEVPVL